MYITHEAKSCLLHSAMRWNYCLFSLHEGVLSGLIQTILTQAEVTEEHINRTMEFHFFQVNNLKII